MEIVDPAPLTIRARGDHAQNLLRKTTKVNEPRERK
jgi:hypothetical protein